MDEFIKDEAINNIEEYSLEEIMGESFSKYSKFIIQDRAIPDVRDGLKPVQRRILFSMYKNKNFFESKEKKSAHVVGDVMGKYHPHGDSSIYDAMVRMSQSWKSNHPLITIRGNNGSIDGDGAAASRYTEAKMSKITSELLKDLDKDTVIFTNTYDDTSLEPTVLPCRFPNLLVSGTMGISAGYATNIPTHNLSEVIDATIMRINNKNCTIDDILEVIPGPDFPTGGKCIGKEGIRNAFLTGRGKVIIRSTYEVVTLKNMKQIVINEIPFEVNKQLLVQKINEIRIDKKIDGIIDAKDESDKEVGYRIVIDIKSDADSELIINYLLKNTDLQTSYNYNMVAIANRRPKQLGILDIIDAYIEHTKEVITKRSKFDLENANNKHHITLGLIKAISILDEVIKTIRRSNNKQDAKINLVKEFDFTEIQAENIVMLHLYKLTNTDIKDLMEQKKLYEDIIKELTEILNSESKLMKIVTHDLKRIKDEYGIARKTEIIDEVSEIKIDENAIIPKEDVIVVLTKEGYIKRISKKSYKSSNEEIMLKEKDYILNILEINTQDVLLVFTNLGNYLYLKVHTIKESKAKEIGKHIGNYIEIKSDEYVIGAIKVTDFNCNKNIVVTTKNGMILRSNLENLYAQRISKAITLIKLKDDNVVSVNYEEGSDVVITTNKGHTLIFDVEEIKSTNIKGTGLKAISLKDDYVISSYTINKQNKYLSVFTKNGYIKRIDLNKLEIDKRAKKGALIIRDVKSNPNRIIKALILNDEDKVNIITGEEITEVINKEISILDTKSTGNKIVDTIDNAYSIEKLETIN